MATPRIGYTRAKLTRLHRDVGPSHRRWPYDLAAAARVAAAGGPAAAARPGAGQAAEAGGGVAAATEAGAAVRGHLPRHVTRGILMIFLLCPT